MLTNIFENRGRDFTALVKLGDMLGRSLRENVEIFSVEGNKVTYVTESDAVIRGTFNLKPFPKLTDIEIETAQIFEDVNTFNGLVNKRVTNLISNLFENDYARAEDSFDEVLSVWETRLHFNRVKARLHEKTSRFGKQTKIIETAEFQRLMEVTDQIIKFLKENSKKINVPEIRNAVKLATVISESFQLPPISFESLAESKEFSAHSKNADTIYEFLCKQELIRKELLESKQSFDSIWGSNEKINKLISLVFSKDEEVLAEAVAEVVSEIPYFAMVSKKDIYNLVVKTLSEDVEVTQKQIVAFAEKICEMKKPVKAEILKILNEKYGIKVSALNDVPTFSSLIEAEVLVFEALSRIAPKGSVVRKLLGEASKMLKGKNGVEAIDVMDFLNSIFTEAGYQEAINETSLLNYLDFNQVASDLSKIGAVLQMIRPMIQGGGAPPAQGMGLGAPDPMGGEAPMEMGGGNPDPLEDAGQMDEMPPSEPSDDNAGMAGMPAEDAAAEASDEFGEEAGPEIVDGDMGEGEGEMEGEMMPQEAPEMAQEELLSLMSTLEDLINGIKAEVSPGMEGEEGGAFGGEETPEEEAMEMMDDEDGDININTSEGDDESDDDEVHIDIDSHKGEDEEEYEEDEDEGEEDEEEED